VPIARSRITSVQRRKRLRLERNDYGATGAYFVTVSARQQLGLFGRVVEDRVALSHTGRGVAAALEGIGSFHAGVELDRWIVMPNHVHLIVLLDRQRFRPPPVPAVVGAFKARASRRAGQALWQRGYYDRIIRDERELTTLRAYIEQNPVKWAVDLENPERVRRGPSTRAG
jgi:REP element-mobilizing transposase RayT